MGVFRFGPSGGVGWDADSFDDPIDDGAEVVAITVRAGLWIDAIQVIARRRNGTGPLIFNPYRGGGGGTFGAFAFAPGELLLDITGTVGNYVDSIHIRTSFGRAADFGVRNPSHTGYTYSIPPGHHLAGFFGASGEHLDSLGVIIRTPPAVSLDDTAE